MDLAVGEWFLVVVVVILILLSPSIYHWCRSTYELKRYLTLDNIQKRHQDVQVLETPRGRIVYRYTKAYSLPDEENFNDSSSLIQEEDYSDRKHPYPICLPGGLGSTLMNTSFIHAKLVRAGFDVLSYDRLGVGLSAWPFDKKTPNFMQDTIEEMDRVMNDANPDAKGWIIIGGSYGSAVGQLYTSQYPEKVVAFINWDGLPYYLSQLPKVKKSFKFVALVYAIEAFFSDMGYFRFMIWLFYKLKLSSSYRNSGFEPDEVYAEFQDSKLLRTIQKEAPIMMDCCDMLTDAWGDINFDHLSKDLYKRLIDCPPDLSVTHSPVGDAEHNRFISPDERREKDQLREILHSHVTRSPIALRWRQIPVVSLSCRNYDYDRFELFMTKENKDLYAAEHAFLALLSRQGQRIVFPDKSHVGSVTLGDYLVKYATSLSETAQEFANNQ